MPDNGAPVKGDREGWKAGIVITPDKHLLILWRAPRSKWYRLTCFCKRVRKDGTCKRTDPFFAEVNIASRTRLEHPDAAR